MRDKLSPAEVALSEAVANGEEANLGRDINPRAIADGSAYPNSRVVRADVLERLLRDDDLPHAPVRLTGARVVGPLRLAYGTLRRALHLDLCWLDDVVVLADARTGGIEFVRCRLPALRLDAVDIHGGLAARECTVGSVAINDSKVLRSVSFDDSRVVAAAAPIRARNLEIGGSLLLNRTRVFSSNHDAIHTDSLRVGNSLELTGARLVGALTVDGARIGGDFDGAGIVVRNGRGVGVQARHVYARSVVLDRSQITGGVDLRHATISGAVLCNGAVIWRPGNAAFMAGDIEAGRLHIEDGARVCGQVSLPRASILGRVALRGLQLSNPDGQAFRATSAEMGSLVADEMNVTGQFICDELKATSVQLPGARISAPDDRSALVLQAAAISRDLDAKHVSCDGTLNIKGVRVGGAVHLTGARLEGGRSYALAASSCQVGERFSLDDGSDVRGDIDFAHADIGKSVVLDWSSIRGTVRLFQARVRSDVLLRGAYIESPGFGIDGIGLQVDGRFTGRGMVCDGAVRLTAMSADSVVLAGAQIHNPGGNAVTAARMDVRGNLEFGEDPHTTDPAALQAFGGIVIRDSHVGGDLVFDSAVLSHPGRRAVHATSIDVGGKLSLERVDVHGTIVFDKAQVRHRMVVKDANFGGFGTGSPDGMLALSAVELATGELLIDGGHIVGAVRLTGSTVTVGVSLRGATISAPGGVAVVASGIVTGEIKLTDLDVSGAVVVIGAEIGGDLVIERGRFRHPKKVFDGSRMTLAGSLSVTGAELFGSIVAGHAVIGLNAMFTLTTIVVDEEGNQGELAQAIDFGAIRAGGSIECRGLTADGQVSLAEAVVTGRVAFRGGSRLSAESWPALFGPGLEVLGAVELGWQHADGPVDLTISGDVSLDRARLGAVAFHRTALVPSIDGKQPQVTLREAQVDRGISMDTLVIRNGSKAAIDLSSVQAGAIELPQGDIAIDLRDVAVRTLVLDPSDTTTVQMSGLRFDDPGNADVETALAWLRRDPDGYQHQIYEQLAEYFRRRGDEASARMVMLARQRHQRARLSARTPGQFVMKAWGYLQDLTVGYGYRPGLAAVWFAGLLAAGTAYFSLRAAPGPVEVNVHPTFNAFGYTLDLLIPLLSFGQDLAWDPLGPDFVVAYGLIFGGGVLATTIAAAVTRVLARR